MANELTLTDENINPIFEEIKKLVNNIERMRKFYIYFPIATTVSSQLSWSHYLEIIKIEEEQKRNFYIKETINSKWSVRELQRQRDSLLYERLILSADKNKILELSEKGAIIIMTNKFIKNALDYIIFHLQLKCNQKYRTSL